MTVNCAKNSFVSFESDSKRCRGRGWVQCIYHYYYLVWSGDTTLARRGWENSEINSFFETWLIAVGKGGQGLYSLHVFRQQCYIYTPASYNLWSIRETGSKHHQKLPLLSGHTDTQTPDPQIISTQSTFSRDKRGVIWLIMQYNYHLVLNMTW